MYVPKLAKDIRCPLEWALDIFGGRWRSRVLCLLYNNETMRYGEIKRYMKTITDAALATALRELVRDELISRQQFDTVPPCVQYRLTERGRELVPLLRNICQWASRNEAKLEGENQLSHCDNCVFARSGMQESGLNIPRGLQSSDNIGNPINMSNPCEKKTV